jgi:hypothetical protein
MKYRKKPVVVEAMQFTGKNHTAVREWGDELGKVGVWDGTGGGGMVIPTLEGDHRADPGDWIIRGVKGEFYPCKPDIFEATYEAVSE